MQQKPPRRQEPLGRPPDMEHTVKGEQTPDSPWGDVQLSNVGNELKKFGFKEMGSLLARWFMAANGLNVDPEELNRLLKKAVLSTVALNEPRPIRPSA